MFKFTATVDIYYDQWTDLGEMAVILEQNGLTIGDVTVYNIRSAIQDEDGYISIQSDQGPMRLSPKDEDDWMLASVFITGIEVYGHDLLFRLYETVESSMNWMISIITAMGLVSAALLVIYFPSDYSDPMLYILAGLKVVWISLVIIFRSIYKRRLQKFYRMILDKTFPSSEGTQQVDTGMRT